MGTCDRSLAVAQVNLVASVGGRRLKASAGDTKTCRVGLIRPAPSHIPADTARTDMYRVAPNNCTPSSRAATHDNS